MQAARQVQRGDATAGGVEQAGFEIRKCDGEHRRWNAHRTGDQIVFEAAESKR